MLAPEGGQMKILYENPFAMSDEKREAALKLLSGKRINIHAVERVDGASTAARLVRETAERFGATQVDLGQRNLNQDVFVSIHNGAYLPFQCADTHGYVPFRTNERSWNTSARVVEFGTWCCD
jgi:hypothetical protein